MVTIDTTTREISICGITTGLRAMQRRGETVVFTLTTSKYKRHAMPIKHYALDSLGSHVRFAADLVRLMREASCAA